MKTLHIKSLDTNKPIRTRIKVSAALHFGTTDSGKVVGDEHKFTEGHMGKLVQGPYEWVLMPNGKGGFHMQKVRTDKLNGRW